ncbi:MAG: DMT family transporter [Paramuribaculum sp.]|nr:DMT family transporter [Paramuribaculum sp.]MDE5920790.1 DMT family transporter [Paramuribaculum sp.]
MKASSRAIVLAAVTVLSWSTVATAFKIALASMGVAPMIFVSVFAAFVVHALWMTLSRSWGELRRLSPRLWARFALLGLIAPVSYYFVLFEAYDHLPAQIAQPINYTWPIILSVLIAVIDRRPVPAAGYIGMAVSLAGVALISLGGGVDGSVSLTGISLAFASALLWALYWIVNDSLKSAVSETTSLFLTFFFGTLYLALWSLFRPLGPVDFNGLMAGCYIGIFEMGLPFICFGIALRTTDNPALVNQLCYLAPFLSLLFVAIFVGETIMPSTYVGLTLIVGGIICNRYFTARSRRVGNTSASS